MNEEDYKDIVQQLVKDVSEIGYEIHSIRKEFTYIFMQMSKTARLTNERIDLLNKKIDKFTKKSSYSMSRH